MLSFVVLLYVVIFLWALPAAAQQQSAQKNMTPRAAYIAGELALRDRAINLAVAHYTKAALAGHVASQYRLGQVYQHFKASPQAVKSAAYWYQKAARGMYPPAMYEFGRMNYFGIGMPKRPYAGITYLQRAARVGNVEASMLLQQILPAGY